MIRMIKRENCHIAYDMDKKGDRPNVVLIHGYGVDCRMWQPQIEVLENYNVINIDVRGHGESHPCDSFSVKEAACDLREILVVEKSEKAVLIGLSMGGYIVQEYAANYGGAGGYWIIGSTPAFLPCYPEWEKLALKHSAALMRLYPWEYLKDTMAKSTTVTGQARDFIRPMFDTMEKKEFLKFWKSMAEALYVRDMVFDAPLLVSCGEKDVQGTVKKHMNDWTAYDNCIIKTIPEAAHLANVDNPQCFNEIMLEFIDQCVIHEV